MQISSVLTAVRSAFLYKQGRCTVAFVAFYDDGSNQDSIDRLKVLVKTLFSIKRPWVNISV